MDFRLVVPQADVVRHFCDWGMAQNDVAGSSKRLFRVLRCVPEENRNLRGPAPQELP